MHKYIVFNGTDRFFSSIVVRSETPAEMVCSVNTLEKNTII